MRVSGIARLAILLGLAIAGTSCVSFRSDTFRGSTPIACTQTFRFAAVADTHVDSPTALAQLRTFLHALRQEGQADFVLILGDICGHAPEYLPLVQNVAEHSGIPVYTLPGNNDDNYGRNRDWYAQSFGARQRAFAHCGWHLILHADDSQPDLWLLRELSQQPVDRPIIFCRHYPPANLPHADSQEPWRTVMRYPNVQVALCGHEHRESSWQLHGLHGLTLDPALSMPGMEPRAYLFEAGPLGVKLLRRFSFAELPKPVIPDAPPAVTISFPADAFPAPPSFTLSGTTSDDQGVRRVEYALDEGPWLPAEGTAPWQASLDTRRLADGHHTVAVRATDRSGQYSLQPTSCLFQVQNTPRPAKVLCLQQGRDGYQGCLDLTVRRHDPNPDPADARLECWVGKHEFSEFYIRYDLATLPDRVRRIRSARLVLQCSHQNSIGSTNAPSRYYVGAVQAAWSRGTVFATRPSIPAWQAPKAPDPAALVAGAWQPQGGRQEVWPPQPVVIDLTPHRALLDSWLRHPETNHGLVVSPAPGPDTSYNQSFESSRSPVPTLRPALELEFEP
jgi:predicted phosphodiesterase